jgi:XTP/dITP diphosphohydrolase
MSQSHPHLESLIATMARLRGDDGCPWDAEQTHATLVPYLLEEVFELVEALESGTRDDIVEELGDVLYQILFHADIGASDTVAPFDIDDVAQAVESKMRRRHPHVFAVEGSSDQASVDQVVAAWEVIKATEKNHRTSAVEGIPRDLSALARAASVLRRSHDVVAPPVNPLVPELDSEEALGEFLLAVVAMAAQKGLNPETALRGATREREAQVRAAEAAASGLAPGDTDA